MNAYTIGVLVPVLARPHRILSLMDSFHASLQDSSHAEMYFVANPNDAEEVSTLLSVGANVILTDRVSWAQKINDAYRKTKEPWMLLGADDIKFHKGWVEKALPYMQIPTAGVVGTNDLYSRLVMEGKTSTHPLVRRSYADQQGTLDGPGAVVFDGYRHNFPDTELSETAKYRNAWVFAKDCVVEHQRGQMASQEHDVVYRIGEASFQADQKIYWQRIQRLSVPSKKPCCGGR